MSGTVDGDCTGTVRELCGDCQFFALRARALFWSFVLSGLPKAESRGPFSTLRTSVKEVFLDILTGVFTNLHTDVHMT